MIWYLLGLWMLAALTTQASIVLAKWSYQRRRYGYGRIRDGSDPLPQGDPE